MTANYDVDFERRQLAACSKNNAVEAHQNMKELELLVGRNERQIDRHMHCDENALANIVVVPTTATRRASHVHSS